MLTSRDLLYKALAYDGFWNGSKKMQNSIPGQYRREQLETLFAAFGISRSNAKSEGQSPYEAESERKIVTVYASSSRSKPLTRLAYIKSLSDFRYFSAGEFIADFEKARYVYILEQIVPTAKAIFPGQSEAFDKKAIVLTDLFRKIYDFRLKIYHMLEFRFSQPAIQRFSLEEQYSDHIMTNIIEAIKEKLTPADELLCCLIDPEKRSFQPDLIGYREFDFETIDKRWMSEIRMGIKE